MYIYKNAEVEAYGKSAYEVFFVQYLASLYKSLQLVGIPAGADPGISTGGAITWKEDGQPIFIQVINHVSDTVAYVEIEKGGLSRLRA